MQTRNKVILIVLGVLVVAMVAIYSSSAELFQGRMFSSSKPLPAYDENKCYDTDGGKNYEEAGIIYGKLSRSEFGNKTDVCTTRTKGKEYYCDGKFIQSEEYACENGCSGGACKKVLTNKQYPMTMVKFTGNQLATNLNVGDVYELSDKDFLRLDKIENGTAHLTIWNADFKGCRMVSGGTYLNYQDDDHHYAYYRDWLIELEALDETSIKLNIFTGDLAYQKCVNSPINFHRCLAFHEVGMYKVESANFARYFESASYYTYNNLMLNYSEAAYSKLKSAFPGIASAHPYGDKWNFIAPFVSESESNSAWMDTAVMPVYIGSTQGGLLTNNYLVDNYAQKISDGDLSFLFPMEVHEWTHMFLYPTELLHMMNFDGTTSKLSEGIAVYLQNLIHYYPDGVDNGHNFCGEDGFVGEETSYNGMTYIEVFNQGDIYTPGDCFFKKIETACGFGSIDTMFANLLLYQYEPFSYHPNLFKILRDNCSDKISFDDIMSTFGFSSDLLKETYQQGSYVPIKEMACK